MAGTHNTYQFDITQSALLVRGDNKDPFRFYSDPIPAQAIEPSKNELSFRVQDLDNNRKIDEKDRFVFINSHGKKFLLDSKEALKVFNYYMDPELLVSKGLGVSVTHRIEEDLLAEAKPTLLEAISEWSAEDLIFMKELHYPYWEVDGHIDLDILAGLRIYTKEENDRWTGIQGVGIYWDKRYFAKRVLGEKGAVALSFIGIEHLAGAPFVWQMYTTNFLSMVGGSVTGNSREEGIIEAGRYYADGHTTTNNTRRLINLQTAKSRSNLAKDHLYFTVTWPVVLAACFADPHFRTFWPAPWKLPRFGVLYNYFGVQFSRAIPFVGRSPFGLGATLLTGYGIYEMSSAWFDLYGHMPQGSTENRAFSLGSTVLTQAALYSRTSRELEILTGSNRFTWSALTQVRNMEVGVGMMVEKPKINLFGLKFPFPKPSPYMEWTEKLSSSQLMQRFSAVEGMGAVESGGSNMLARQVLMRRLSAGEMLTTQRAGLSVMSRLAVPATEAELMSAESFVLRSRMKSVGIPLWGTAALLGVGVGFCYLTGIFNKERNLRTVARDVFGF